MTKQDFAEFSRIYLAHAEMCGRQLSTDAVGLHFSACKDLTLEQWRTGLNRHVNDPERGKFLAQPGDIRRALGELTPTEKAERAWAELLRAIEKHYPYDSVVFGDRCLAASVVALGGWERCGEWLEDELQWRRKEFVSLYAGFVASGIPRSTPVKFVGRHERENRNRGYLGQGHPRHVLAPVALVGEGAARLLEEMTEDKSGEVIAKLHAMVKENGK